MCCTNHKLGPCGGGWLHKYDHGKKPNHTRDGIHREKENSTGIKVQQTSTQCRLVSLKILNKDSFSRYIIRQICMLCVEGK